MKKIIINILLILLPSLVNGQMLKLEKRIYIVDVTASMEGKGSVKTENIFAKVKQNLKEAVQNIKEPNTEVSLITFSNKIQNIYTGNSSKMEELVKKIEKIEVKKGNTNVIDAWKEGVRQIDSTRTNIIFLLTDGLHNEGQPIDSLYSTLRNWENISNGKTYYGFYVMLTKEAVQQKLIDVVSETKQLYPIVSMNIGTSLISTPESMSVNLSVGNKLYYKYRTNNGSPLPVDFTFKVQISENPYYDLVESNIDKQKNAIYLLLKEKVDHSAIPVDYVLNFNYLYDKDKYPLVYFIPDNFKLRTVNKGIRKMTLKIK